MAPKAVADYAVYRGDELLSIGTIKECSEHLGVKEETLRFYTSPVYKKRVEKRNDADSAIIVFRIEDDEEGGS
jgi:hypothetical protein